MILVIDKTNNNDGVNGKQIILISEDGKCDSKEAVNAANKLININKVNILFSTCSTETMALIPIIKDRNVIVISISSIAELTGASENIFRIGMSDKEIALTLAEIMSKKYNNIAILTESGRAYPNGIKKDFVNIIKDKGDKIIIEDFPENSKDLKTELTKIISQEAEAILINPDGVQQGIIALNQLKELGYTGDVYGNYIGSMPEVQALDSAEGLIYAADPKIKNINLKHKYHNEYKNKFGEEIYWEFYSSAAYDGINIIIKSIENTKSDDPNIIKHYLRNIKRINGLLGEYYFDENQDATNIKPSIKQIRNHKVVEV